MAFKWTIRRLNRWGISRRKLRGGLIHSRLGDRVLDRELWFPTRESLARAWLVGMPVTWIPFLPMQTLIACTIAFMVRANVPVTFALQFLSNPATGVLQLPACYIVGCWVLGREVGPALSRMKNAPLSVLSGDTVGALILGALVLGFVTGIAGYGLTHALWRKKPPRIRPLPPPGA